VFLESNFAYAVYDFLECKKEAGDYNKLRKRCGEETLRELEEIAKEAFSLEERKKTRNFLLNIIKKGNIDFMKEIRSYLAVFYRSDNFKYKEKLD